MRRLIAAGFVLCMLTQGCALLRPVPRQVWREWHQFRETQQYTDSAAVESDSLQTTN